MEDKFSPITMNKICIVKLSAMGDIIHAMVALEFIKNRYPDIQIDWIVEECFSSILQDNPHIDNILPINLKSIKKNKSAIFSQFKILKKYRQNNYDLVIDAQGLLKSAIVAKIVGKNIITGFDKNSIREKIATCLYNKTVSIDYNQNTIDRNVKVLCKPLSIDVTSKEIIEKNKFLFSNSAIDLQFDQYNIFVIGSTWDSRNYPKEKFVELANELKTNTYIAWGNEEEKIKAIWMQTQSEYIQALPKLNLNELKSVIGDAKLLIGNDTGPTHMAWGMNIPSITIFGPTPTNRVYITPINKVVKSKSKVEHLKLDKNDFSIKEIEVSKIIKKVKEIEQQTKV